MDVTIAGSTLHIEMDRIDGDIRDDLDRYLDGDPVVFEQAVDLSGLTAFQQSVLSAIRDVSYGHTMTYTGLAAHIGRPDAVRAVANACGVNPVPILIPCHRIVAKDGLGGYTAGRHVKRQLLALEDAR